MLNIKALSILAIAGTAVAAPQGWGSWPANYFRGGQGGHKDDSSDNKGTVATDVKVVTAYTTVTAQGNWNYGGQKPSATASPVVAYTPAPSADKPADKPATSSPAPVASSGGSDSGYMGTVGTWRSKMGLSALTQDSKLQANALKTAQDGNGQMKHELNPGSMAQVLAPGSPSDFEKVFVGGWLCERPNLPGLNGICTSMSKGWAYDGQTGHADILSSSKYSKIGCANAGGIWSCDLA